MIETGSSFWPCSTRNFQRRRSRTRCGTYAACSTNSRIRTDCAIVVLEKRVCETGLDLTLSSRTLPSLIKLYFERFGDKLCCFHDLKPYTVLEDAELSAFDSYLDAHTHVSPGHRVHAVPLKQRAQAAAACPWPCRRRSALSPTHAYTAALRLGGALPETERTVTSSGYISPASTVRAPHRTVYGYDLTLNLLVYTSGTIARVAALPMRVKQVQNGTLSHFILARAATFLLCVEASQIYATNSSEMSEFIVRVFASDPLDNSLQRDFAKIEHVRMRLAHEGPSTELADTELIELKFIFDRIHYDNRYFDVLPNNRLRGQPNHPTILGLYVYTSVFFFLLASDGNEAIEEKVLSATTGRSQTSL
ncbi:hypothetical protein DFH11DRAFT_1883361 [Phellopilus nigrolimitatus]|nr:hypothetical protein DFH11DRAFT_1883361 [Phellopilus nigrolimitatus]